MVMRSRWIAIVVSVAFFGTQASVLAPSLARADEFYTFVVKKQEEKAKSRWSLKEWLDTKDRIKMMDLWLALHSPSPYEFFVGTAYRMLDGPGGRSSGTALQAAAYASIFGLGLERSLASPDSTSAEFLFRVFGYHAQSSNITFHAGVRSQSVRNAYAGLGMSVYLSRFFGLDGQYRRHFAAVPNASGITNASVLLEGGAFIDFDFLRVFLNTGTSTPDGAESTGQTTLGVRLFF